MRTDSKPPTINVAIVVMNNFQHDSRVLKTSHSISAFAHKTKVIALQDKGQPELLMDGDVAVRRLRISFRRLRKFRFFLFFAHAEFSIKVIANSFNCDVIHCNDLSTLPAGIALKFLRLGKVKVVYDSHEYQTQLQGLERRPLERLVRSRLEKALIRYADETITVSESIADEYKRIYSIEKVTVVKNCPVHQQRVHSDLLREEFFIPPQDAVFLYQGNLSAGRGISILVEAFSKLAKDFHLVLMGNGELETMTNSAIRSSSNIHLRNAVSLERLHLYTSSADFGVSLIENTCLNYYYCLPNKLFEYIQAEIPVLVSNTKDQSILVGSCGIGVIAEGYSSDSIIESAIKLRNLDYQTLRENIRSIKHEYCWETEEEKLKALYGRLLRPSY